MSEQKIRVVVAKPGLDGHDRGAKIIARALRDAGLEVIYTGLHQTPEPIAATVQPHRVGIDALLNGGVRYLLDQDADLQNKASLGTILRSSRGAILALRHGLTDESIRTIPGE
jgi:methylmalonyl-CoA mutase C-terminal domain/subunit